MAKTFILTCDGGGIRGYITASVLSELVSAAGGSLSQVNVHAGTSTGSFIALALAAGQPVSTILTAYQQANAQKIFTPDPNLATSSMLALRDRASELGLSGIWSDIVKYFAYFTNASYANTGLEDTGLALLSSNSQALTLGQIGNVLVNTLQLDDGGTWTPQTITNWNTSTYLGMYAYEAALCSGAAPIYFPPYSPSSAPLGFCADGGLFANNPSMTAIVTAIQQKVDLSDLYVLSLDTGTTQDGMSANVINGTWGGPLSMGPLQWLIPYAITAGDTVTPKFPLLSALMDGSAAAITAQAGALLGAHYCRVTVPLTAPVALDDASTAAYTTMNDSLAAWKTAGNYSAVVSWLTSNFPA